MKKILAVSLMLFCLLCLFSCNKEAEQPTDSGFKILTQDDVKTKRVDNSNRVFQVESVNGEGKTHIVFSKYAKNSDGSYSFLRNEKQYMDAKIDENTVILMGDIVSYDGTTKLADYDKTTSLEYFIKHCSKPVNGKPLYFTAEIEKGYISQIELFWDYYFAE